MVLFKLDYKGNFKTYKNIYIPLWSYSNHICKAHLERISYNLHSTMVLFKLNIWKSYLCTCKIYIPLWSYSNLRATTPLVINKVFTFHYGPIQITTPKRITNGNTIIYIPLWSYSNMPGRLRTHQM